jgi:hypothetical protein
MIEIIEVDDYIRKNMLNGPVTSQQLFLGKSTAAHPNGLLSEEIFGIEGSPERKTSVSWIDLNCHVIHPVLYNILIKRIERKLEDLIKGDTRFTFSPEGYLQEDPEGEHIGISGLVKNIHKWKFRRGDDDEGDRNKIIDMLYKNINQGTFFMDKLLVVPPDFRRVELDEDNNEISNDDFNEIYRKAIVLSNSIQSLSGDLFDVLSFNMQKIMKQLYEMNRIKVSKKQGMIRKLMLGKRVDFSARSVISPNPNLKLGEVGIPLRIVVSIFEPQLLYGLSNSKEAALIPQEFHDECKKFLGKEVGVE